MRTRKMSDVTANEFEDRWTVKFIGMGFLKVESFPTKSDAKQFAQTVRGVDEDGISISRVRFKSRSWLDAATGMRCTIEKVTWADGDVSWRYAVRNPTSRVAICSNFCESARLALECLATELNEMASSMGPAMKERVLSHELRERRRGDGERRRVLATGEAPRAARQQGNGDGGPGIDGLSPRPPAPEGRLRGPEGRVRLELRRRVVQMSATVTPLATGSYAGLEFGRKYTITYTTSEGDVMQCVATGPILVKFAVAHLEESGASIVSVLPVES